MIYSLPIVSSIKSTFSLLYILQDIFPNITARQKTRIDIFILRIIGFK